MKRINDKKNLYKNPRPQKEVSLRPVTDDIRLNKYIASAGLCSRRDADIMITEGKVQVNGNTITELGYKIKSSDTVSVNDKKIQPQNFIYILLNKPKNFICTTEDPENRRTILDLIKNATKERVYPVGRLDRNTTGLILITNDGDLTNSLIHPSREFEKIYAVTLDHPLTKSDFAKICEGVELEDGIAKVDELAFTDEKDKSQVGIKIHSGKNRVIRRIFEQLNYEVTKLDRVMFGPLTKLNLPRGKWRFLTQIEVNNLKRMTSKK
jgi:23S rRNA pseudouridine2605 synthase